MSEFNYTFPGPFTPFKHQISTTKFIVDNPRCFVLNEMGLGKSASALWAIDYLMNINEVKRALVVAPLSTLHRVWQDEAFKLLTHRRSALFYGSAAQRKKLYATDWEIGIINFDGVPILKDELAKDVASGRLDMIVIDEASAYRNMRTKRWKLMKSFSKYLKRFVLMTGTPCPEAPTDAYGLAKLLAAREIPWSFSVWQAMTMHKVTQFKWLPRECGYELAYKLLHPAIRFTKKDCLDLPPLLFEDRETELSKEQRIAYDSMRKNMLLQVQSEGGIDEVTAVHAADRIGKLRQIACGVVKDTTSGEYLLLDYKPRLQTLLEAIGESLSKVIVVAPYKGIMLSLVQEIGQHYTVEMINGDTPPSKRGDIINRFRHTPDPHVLLVHPKVLAHGLTLVEASTLIFYGPIYSSEETKQIIERINRPGQKNPMTVVRIGAVKLEWRIYKAVETKSMNEDSLLDMYRSVLLDG